MRMSLRVDHPLEAAGAAMTRLVLTRHGQSI
jgi:hypothetical protein